MIQIQFKEPLSKKYRPQNFFDIIYHEEIKTILINSILERNIANGILLYGEKGTGKTTIARIFAKSINCQNAKDGYEPCNICDSCLEITSSRHPDVMEIDAASKNSVDSIRELIEEAKYLPVKSEYKIYILDEVHMLSNSAFNALLKILEEPPYYVKFCLSTTEYHKIPATITSRCQRLNLRKINNEILKQQLFSISEKENIKIDEKSLNIISAVAKGSARDAISILDQASILTNKNITANTLASIIGYQDDEDELIELIDEMCDSNVEKSLKRIDDLYQKNISIDLFFNKILDLLTELMVYQKTGMLNEKQSLYISNIDIQKIQNIVSRNNFEKLNRIWSIFAESQNILKDNIYDNQLYLLNLTILRATVNESEKKYIEDAPIQKIEQKKTLDTHNNIQDTKQNIVQPQESAKDSRRNISDEKAVNAKQNIVHNDEIQHHQKIQKSEDSSNEEKRLLENHSHLLYILNKLKEVELLNVAQNNGQIFHYQKFEIYDNHTIPNKYLQMFVKILRQYSKQKWRIIYLDNDNQDRVSLNEVIDVEEKNEAIAQLEDNEKKNSISDIKTQFLETNFFKNLKEKFDIGEENVKITK